MMRFRYFRDGDSLKLDLSKCIKCGMCVEVCPHDVFGLEKRKAHILRAEYCMECGACAKNCPTGAIRVSSGVGCAAAIISGFLNKTEPSCDCSGGKSKSCC